MSPVYDNALGRLDDYHTSIEGLVKRIHSCCQSMDTVASCQRCGADQYRSCLGNLRESVVALLTVTLKHNAIESILMRLYAPSTHCREHERANCEIAVELYRIREALKLDSNCLSAIQEISGLLVRMLAHADDLDKELEGYIAAVTAETAIAG